MRLKLRAGQPPAPMGFEQFAFAAAGSAIGTLTGFRRLGETPPRDGEGDRHILLRRLRTTIAAMVPGQSPRVPV